MRAARGLGAIGKQLFANGRKARLPARAAMGVLCMLAAACGPERPNTDIRAWIDTWNDNPRPYVWTKTADQILASIGNYCTRINDSGH